MDKEVSQRDVQVGPIHISITECGAGAPLVLIHGLGGSPMWSKVILPLSETFHVFAVDLPGFGRSSAPTKPLSVRQQSEFLQDLISVLRLKKVTLIGVSYGGQVAATMAAYYPEDVDKLVLIATTGSRRHTFLTHEIIWPIIQFCARQIVKSVTLSCFFGSRSFYNRAHRPEGLCREFVSSLQGEYKTASWLKAFREALTGEMDWESRCSSIRAPVLILWGKNDRLIPWENAERLQRIIPTSTTRIFHECGHSLPLEKSMEMAEAIRKFLLNEHARVL